MLASAVVRVAPRPGRVSSLFFAKNSNLNSSLGTTGGLRAINARKGARWFSRSVPRLSLHVAAAADAKKDDNGRGMDTGSDAAGEEKARPEHAVISTFDLFSIGGA